MDIQFILMIAIFILALAYIGRLVYRSISPKSNSCGTGCGKCAANFDQIPDLKK
ncbi:FeoB-associated Cys-rich membrane protein [Pedobacter sp.]